MVNHTATMEKLQRKQARFVEIYCSDGNKTLKACAEEAGYVGKNPSATANRLLKKPHIQKAIKEYRQELKVHLRLDETYVLRNLRQIVENNVVTDPAQANRALELIGKTLGMYTDKSKIEQEVTIKKLEDFM